MYKIEAEDLGRKVYRALKNMIINGELVSGQKLFQEELAERLGVSRTPLLSAFSKLEQENLVETIPRRGAFVKRHTQKELCDISDIRIRLEPLGSFLAAKNASAEDIAGLKTFLDDFDAATTLHDDRSLKRADYDLHMEILRFCGNKYLYDMLATFNIIIISNTRGLLKPAEKSRAEHHALFEAIERHDAEGAEKIMFDHTNDSRSRLEKSTEHLVEAAEGR